MNSTFKLAIIAAFTFLSATLNAIPAWRGLMSRTQPDGTTLTYRLMGDEHYHSFVTLSLIHI